MKKQRMISLFSAITLLLPSTALAQQNTGLTFTNPEELRGIPLAATPFSGTDLPKQVDLSPDMPPPGNQGRQNSCVGWSTAYALKSYQERVETNRTLTRNGSVDYDKVFSPAFVYNQINNGRDGGSRFVDALRVLSSQGAVSWSDMPYTDRDYRRKPSQNLQSKAKPYRIDYWRQVNLQDPKEVKAQLNAGYPIIFGAMIDEGFQSTRGPKIWKAKQGGSLGGHAMVLVGYDDDKNAYKLINSWGQRWGDQGFGWVDYDFFPQVAREGYVAKDAINGPDPKATVTESERNTPDPRPTAKPQIRPTPRPQQQVENNPAANSASFSIVNVEHNLDAPAAEYEKFGKFMRLEGKLKVPAEAGRKLQVVVRFYYDNGKGGKGERVGSLHPALFSLAEDGFAATGTPEMNMPTRGVNDSWYAYIPYSAFDVPGGEKVHLVAEPMLYVDRFGIRTAALNRFWVKFPESRQQSKRTVRSAAMSARAFFQSVADEDFQESWALLSDNSQEAFINIIRKEAPQVSANALRRDFENGGEVMWNFWSEFSKSARISSWLQQSFLFMNQDGNVAVVKAQPNGIKLYMRFEDDGWKLDFERSFLN